MSSHLVAYGWSPRLAAAFDATASQGEMPARVVKQTRVGYLVMTATGVEEQGRLAGPLKQARGADRPAVGDWVTAQAKPRDTRLAIRNLLPRQSAFVRRAAGVETREQVVAANVDVVFLVTGLDQDFSLRRIERYLTLAFDSGARPVILLSKADLCPDPDAQRRRVAEVAPGVEVLVISAHVEGGLAGLVANLTPGTTGAFLGSSGVGKSTLVNRLAGEACMRIGAALEVGARGRHTTSHRQLVLLPCGGLVIDTPGMREIQLWAETSSLESAFSDVAALATQCRFRDCRHGQEPGCAVRQAVTEGRLAADRKQSYEGLREELGVLVTRQAEAGRLQDRRGPGTGGKEP